MVQDVAKHPIKGAVEAVKDGEIRIFSQLSGVDYGLFLSESSLMPIMALCQMLLTLPCHACRSDWVKCVNDHLQYVARYIAGLFNKNCKWVMLKAPPSGLLYRHFPSLPIQ